MENSISLTKLGGSLKVPLVQELAKRNLSTVPSRYVRVEGDEHISFNLSYSLEIPTIDFRKLYDSNFMDFELHKLHNACQEWGFFQVINHGVDTKVIETMKLDIQNFFNLPTEEKNKYYQEPGDLQGYGQAFVVSEEQKLDWADMFYIVTQPTHLRKSHLIPKLPPKFRDAIESYSAEMKALAMEILYQMAKALKMKSEEINNLFGEGLQAMRMNCYPPCPQPELVMGLCPHSDAVGLTILLQVNEVVGLQVKKDGLWVPVLPLPGAFVVNVGDALEKGLQVIDHQGMAEQSQAHAGLQSSDHHPKWT
ncbi:Protein SRG1 [Striga hermonthica]|uniref:Protein SRG1 n=1 Tax=Striga hermonthica TaxID=68872 RepID=A0A9N7NLW5_STRHE|nr:Protein SRG1 [Striga hermonthica]